jgi:uncharacterized protein (TIGR02466 family)
MAHIHWPVPLEMHQLEAHEDINPTLARVFQVMRATDLAQRSPEEPLSAFYASSDQLLERVKLPEFQSLVNFIANALQKTIMTANSGVWPPGRMKLQLQIVGCWFQIQNGMAYHDVHTHGNCSWSGVYYVQCDQDAKRRAHPQLGEMNGVTRFYGPYSQWLGGAHMDVGNAYLQKNTLDVDPVPGRLVLFPSYLAHKAMPYEGDNERIIVSFNAQVHAAGGDQIFNYDAT